MIELDHVDVSMVSGGIDFDFSVQDERSMELGAVFIAGCLFACIKDGYKEQYMIGVLTGLGLIGYGFYNHLTKGK